jgi:hypothetical protein
METPGRTMLRLCADPLPDEKIAKSFAEVAAEIASLDPSKVRAAAIVVTSNDGSGALDVNYSLVGNSNELQALVVLLTERLARALANCAPSDSTKH